MPLSSVVFVITFPKPRDFRFFFERTVFVTFFLEEEIFSTGPSKATYLAFIEREDRSEKRGKSTSFKTPYNISALL